MTNVLYEAIKNVLRVIEGTQMNDCKISYLFKKNTCKA